MADTLFTNVRILDGTGAEPYSGSVMVQGNRIHRVGRGSAAIAPSGATVIDGAGATLMPGMCEAHTHFSWNDSATLAGIQAMPLEEHVLWCAKVAKQYLQAGWTSCVGAACAKPRLDVVIRNAIAKGQIAVVHYTGWLYAAGAPDNKGKKFDSSVDRGEPFRFPLGTGSVIQGWDEGVVGMQVGGKRVLTIPPEMGYGARGAGGVIPGGATLLFEVELLGIE